MNAKVSFHSSRAAASTVTRTNTRIRSAPGLGRTISPWITPTPRHVNMRHRHGSIGMKTSRRDVVIHEEESKMPKAVTEMRADFQHLRRWRKSVEQAQGFTFKAVISIIVAGFLGAVWLGIKAMLSK